MNNNQNKIIDALNEKLVIAYPTEAVYGVGCDPDCDIALQKLLTLKQRDWQKGLILIAANYAQLLPYIDDEQLSDEQRQQMFATWPGPNTWVVPVKKGISSLLTGRFDSLAVRVSAHQDVQRLCLAYGKPLVSTSANLSGQEPARSKADIIAQFGETFPVLDGALGGRLNPSIIRDARTGELLRQG